MRILISLIMVLMMGGDYKMPAEAPSDYYAKNFWDENTRIIKFDKNPEISWMGTLYVGKLNTGKNENVYSEIIVLNMDGRPSEKGEMARIIAVQHLKNMNTETLDAMNIFCAYDKSYEGAGNGESPPDWIVYSTPHLDACLNTISDFINKIKPLKSH
ncbi:MAG: hypothetical protein AAB564_02230 [Patescibacteria group bacterium]